MTLEPAPVVLRRGPRRGVDGLAVEAWPDKKGGAVIPARAGAGPNSTSTAPSRAARLTRGHVASDRGRNGGAETRPDRRQIRLSYRPAATFTMTRELTTEDAEVQLMVRGPNATVAQSAGNV